MKNAGRADRIVENLPRIMGNIRREPSDTSSNIRIDTSVGSVRRGSSKIEFPSGSLCRYPGPNTPAPVSVLILDPSVYHFMASSLRLYIEYLLLHSILVLNAAIYFVSELNILIISTSFNVTRCPIATFIVRCPGF